MDNSSRGLSLEHLLERTAPGEKNKFQLQVTINGADYVSIGSFIRCLDTDERNINDFEPDAWRDLIKILERGGLRAIRQHPAPHHSRMDFTGDVNLDTRFWQQAWWLDEPDRDISASREWHEWLMLGGVLLLLEDVADCMGELRNYRRQHQLGLEGFRRRNFSLLWPATHALAWIIARDDAKVKLLDAPALDQATSWDRLGEIIDLHPDEASMPVLRRAFGELANALFSGKLSGWKWTEGSDGDWPLDITILTVEAFMTAQIEYGSNSCGLLGDLYRKDRSFVLVRPDDVKAIWRRHGEKATFAIPDYAKLHGARSTSDDPWMTLAEVVRWAGWRGAREPKYGIEQFDDGQWVSHGDPSHEQLAISWKGAENVRDALATGSLEAWGQKDASEAQQIPGAHWSRHFPGPSVSWTEFYPPYKSIIVLREKVMALWPAPGGIAGVSPTTRAPAMKAGHAPAVKDILFKADDMKARGLDGRTIAKNMRLEPGFENVATTEVRDLIKGRWKPTGRPAQKGA